MALTNVVVREAPFQRTTDDATKLVPLTVSVRPALPATAPVGERLLATGTGGTDAPGSGGGVGAGGAVMVKVTVPDVPPPGAGVTTLTGTERAVARSAAVIAARS